MQKNPFNLIVGSLLGDGTAMYDALKTKLTVVWILLGVGLMWWVLANRPAGPKKETHPGNAIACANMNVEGIKEGLIKETEDDWSVVYVTDLWNQIPSYGKDELGYYFALCKSENEKTEIRLVSNDSVVGEYVIDLDYRMRTGLPVDHLIPGQ